MRLFGMMRFNKNKSSKWKVLYKDRKGVINSATVVAKSKDDVYTVMKRIFFKAEVIGMVEA